MRWGPWLQGVQNSKAAKIEHGKDDPIDGRSVFPQLNGFKGEPRDWMLSHYQPYWGGFSGRQSVRDQDYKLYRSGEFYNVPKDLKEKKGSFCAGEPGRCRGIAGEASPVSGCRTATKERWFKGNQAVCLP